MDICFRHDGRRWAEGERMSPEPLECYLIKCQVIGVRNNKLYSLITAPYSRTRWLQLLWEALPKLRIALHNRYKTHRGTELSSGMNQHILECGEQ